MVMVDVVAEIAPPAAELPATPPPPSLPPRPVAVRRTTPPKTAPTAPTAPTQRLPPAEEESAARPLAVLPSDATDDAGPPILAGIAAGAAGGTSASRAGDGSGAQLAAAPLTDGQRRSMIDGYLRERVRPRIDAHKRYPDEARDLELTGVVLVQVTIDQGGRLIAARLKGRCPHLLLCDDAVRTVRAAAPFSSPPRALGDSLQIDVPLKYSFE